MRTATRDAVALRRYLQRHAETGLPEHVFSVAHWQQVLVIPAYRESAALLERLARLPEGHGRTLVTLVLNRPDSDTDPLANAGLRDALAQSCLPRIQRDSVLLPATVVLLRPYLVLASIAALLAPFYSFFRCHPL